jgi:hypothetical protein
VSTKGLNRSSELERVYNTAVRYKFSIGDFENERTTIIQGT